MKRWLGTVVLLPALLSPSRGAEAPPPPKPLLPESLVVSYYGNPLSKRMGILGEIEPKAMMDRLAAEAALWQKEDSSSTVRPALELVAGVASPTPQPDGGYRIRMPAKVIDQVIGWARSRGWLIILDVQVGRSTVRKELEWLRPYLEMPDVHLALDPEFHMKRGVVPGKKIGGSDAEDVNVAVIELSRIVKEKNLPPKLLIVHRFTDAMLRRYDRIRTDPSVQVVVLMDGFGPPALKEKVYRRVITREPVEFAGIKLFYKNDQPLMTRRQILELSPRPRVVIYQ